jgi:hypothetical protein
VASRIVHTTKADVEARKKAIEARCITATVTGALPIRDAVDREDRVAGQTVRLDPQDFNNPQPGRTLISALVESGAISLTVAEDKPEA